MPVLRTFVLLLLFCVAACGTTTPQADGIPPVGTGGDANGSVGALEVRDARFAAQRPRAGDEVYAAGEDVPLRAGLTYPVTFTFARAGVVRIEIPVGDPDTLPPRAGDTTG